MKPFISTPQTKQATQPASVVLVQSRVFSSTLRPTSKADVYASLGEWRIQGCYAQA